MDFQANPGYIESLLRRFGVRKIKGTSNGFTALCPFHEDKSPSFSISNTGLWMCWSCKAKGNLRQLHKAFGAGEGDWREALKMMGAEIDRSRYAIAEPKKSHGTIAMPSDFSLYQSEEEVPSRVARRLEWNTIMHFGLGSSGSWPNKDRVVIPIRFRDYIVGYHSRAIKDGMQPRYYNPKGFDIKDHVFNYDECVGSDEIIIVEGAFNAMSMWEKGFFNTMAVFGTQFTAKQIDKIFSLSPKSIVICFDRDSNPERPGQRAAKKLGALAGELIKTHIMPLPLDKDPNDLPVAVLRKCYDARVPFEMLFGGSDGREPQPR